MNALFFIPTAEPMWDTWMYVHEDTFYLYYLIGTQLKWNGVGAAVSRDGVHWEDRGRVITAAEDALWLGSGAVWPAADEAGERFIMNFSEWRGTHEEGRQTIFFAESRDLLHWTRTDPGDEFVQGARWYEPFGRWDCISPLPRADGGYYGYWTAQVRDGKLGLGFGESPDGVTWRALEPPVVSGISFPWLDEAAADTSESVRVHSPHVEVGAVRARNDAYYAIVSDPGFGMSVLVGDSPSGPFSPVPRNRGLLAGNASYFGRFLDTPDGVLVNHQSWVPAEVEVVDEFTNVAEHVHLAPLKRAVWDEADTLRLMWWEGNERAKDESVPVAPSSTRIGSIILLAPSFDDDRVLILEGEMTLPASEGETVGLYLEGAGGGGTAYLVRRDGVVVYGSIRDDGSQFEPIGTVDRELPVIGGSARFRLLRNGRMTEFYVDDVLMQCYSLPERGTGRIGLLGSPTSFASLAAWYCGEEGR